MMEKTTIRGTEYGLIKLDPLRGGRLAAKVGQILAGALSSDGISAMIAAHQAKQGDGTEAAEAMGGMLETPALMSALAGGVAKIDVDALYSIGLDFVRGNLFTDKKLHDDHAFNAHFAKCPDHLLLVLAWAIKVNCSDFFGLGGRG